MAKQAIPKPTDAELAILRVLWDRGPSTVRQVYDVLAADHALVYTTTLKFLQIMTDKGLVVREEQGRSHVYEANHGEEETQHRLLDDLMDRAFGGSAAKLVMRVLADKRASSAELAEIRGLLAKSPRKEKDNA